MSLKKLRTLMEENYEYLVKFTKKGDIRAYLQVLDWNYGALQLFRNSVINKDFEKYKKAADIYNEYRKKIDDYYYSDNG